MLEFFIRSGPSFFSRNTSLSLNCARHWERHYNLELLLDNPTDFYNVVEATLVDQEQKLSASEKVAPGESPFPVKSPGAILERLQMKFCKKNE